MKVDCITFPIFKLKQYFKIAIIFFVAFIIFQLTSEAFTTPTNLTPDSYEYLELANSFQENSFVSATQRSVVRTPFYPFLLSFVVNKDPLSYDNIKLLHLCLVLFVSSISIFLLRPSIGPIFTFLLCLAIFTEARVFAYTVLTEWTSICLFILLFSLYIKYFFCRSVIVISKISFVTSLLVLTRPVFLFLLAFPLLLSFFDQHRLRKFVLTLCISIAPIIFVVCLNAKRYNEPTLSPFLGVSLFGVSTLINSDGQISNDDSSIKQLLIEITRGSAGQDYKQLNNKKLEARYNRNIWQYGEEYRKANNLTYFEWNNILLKTALDLLLTSPLEYIKFIYKQFIQQFYIIEILYWLIVLIAALLIVLEKRLTPVSKAFIIAASIHFTHILICSATNVLFYRLVAVTFYPLLWCALLQIYNYLSVNYPIIGNSIQDSAYISDDK